MERRDDTYQEYLNILKSELVPAFGCTEPIALAYAAAVARKTLGEIPDKVIVCVSGNIIKNVKSVVVPNTGGLVGIEAAVAAGIVAGEEERKLEVLSNITQEQISAINEYLKKECIEVRMSESSYIFDISISVYYKDSDARVRIVGKHTNIVSIEKNGAVLYGGSCFGEQEESSSSCYDSLTIEGIVQFADMVDMEDIREVIGRQIEYNMAIAREGMENEYGADIGQVLIKCYGNSTNVRAKAYAAAGSDARMAGCSLPVVICSGSGNQGITASVPVIVYATDKHIDEERLYRALVVSDLVTIHVKSGVGRLSAYCGVVCAGCGSGAGIAYLMGESCKVIQHTIVNTLAITSGIICDGAKASCAGKIAVSVDAGILGYEMYKNGKQFRAGDGIVTKGVENNIVNIGRLARDGMRQTDKEILNIMMEK